MDPWQQMNIACESWPVSLLVRFSHFSPYWSHFLTFLPVCLLSPCCPFLTFLTVSPISDFSPCWSPFSLISLLVLFLTFIPVGPLSHFSHCWSLYSLFSLLIRAFKHVLVQTFIGDWCLWTVVWAEPELEVSIVVGCEFDSKFDLRPLVVGGCYHPQPVLPSALVWSRLWEGNKEEVKVINKWNKRQCHRK